MGGFELDYYYTTSKHHWCLLELTKRKTKLICLLSNPMNVDEIIKELENAISNINNIDMVINIDCTLYIHCYDNEVKIANNNELVHGPYHDSTNPYWEYDVGVKFLVKLLKVLKNGPRYYFNS